MSEYEIKIYWSEEDKVFIAEVPQLPGCMTHGSTEEEARGNAEEAIKGWLESSR